ncbi:MAG: hypothetical protein HRT68_03945 [Flavobacteriaceae bacterium]|nr:hypothetical protein [Flavobacteriaceae bacterium]
MIWPFKRFLYHPDNHFEELDADDVNRFQDNFNLKDFTPDMTFGSFITKLKNWLNLEITFRRNIVTINYVELRFKNIDFKDARHIEVSRTRITPNTNEAYKLIYSDTNYI